MGGERGRKEGIGDGGQEEVTGWKGGGLPRHFFVDSGYSLLYEVDTWQ